MEEQMAGMEEAALRVLDAALELHAELAPDQREQLALHGRRGHAHGRR